MCCFSISGEVIVVDNNSSDETPVIARENSCRVVFEPYNQISRARNRGAGVAKGHFLIFLDADTKVSPELLGKALLLMLGNKCCGGGARVYLPVRKNGFEERIVALWDTLSVRFNLAAGCFLFCLQEAFESAGGFSETLYAGEEIGLTVRLKAWGKRHHKTFQIIKSPKVESSPRKLEWYSRSEIVAWLVIQLLLPVAPFFRSLSRFWYSRPVSNPAEYPESCSKKLTGKD